MVTTYFQKLRMFSRDVRLYLISSALVGFSVFGGIYTVLFNLYLLRLGYGPKFVGLINGAGLLAFAVFSLPAGAIGGRWGSRRIMIAGMSLSVAGFGLLPLSEFILISLREVWLFFNFMLGYFGLALFIVNANPFLMGATSSEERNHVFSVQAALWPLAGFAGSLVGGFLPGFFARALGISLNNPAPYRYPLLIAALFLIPGVLAILATRKISAGQAKESVAEESPAPYRLMAFMALVGLLQVAGEGGARTFFNVYLDTNLGVSTSLIGALAAAAQLVGVPAALAMPLISSRWGNANTTILGSLGAAMSLLPLALIPRWGAAGVGFMGVMALVSIRRPAYTIYAQEIVPIRWRATMSGATSMAAGLGFSVMAFGGGYIIAALGYRSLFLTGAGLTTAGAILFWTYFRVPRGEFAYRSTSDKAN